jgi:SNF2 family DNA or RNA helicase
MIPKQAIKAFLNRPRNDWSWYKDLTTERLNRRRDNLPVDPPIWNKLQLHQKQGLLLGIRLKKLAYWYSTGSGKTLIALALLRYFQEKGTLTRALVLVPNLTNKEEWAREIEKHAPQTRFLILDGSLESRWAKLVATDATVLIDTYAGFARLMSTKATITGRKSKLIANQQRIAELSKLVNFYVYDESSQGGLGNRGALTYRILNKLSRAAANVYLLNGTPFGRDPTPLWPQMHCIDQGETLGESLGLFREALFNESHNGWATEWAFDEKNTKTLHQMLKHRSLRYQADEADLPPVVRITKHARLSGEAEAVYKKALESLRQAKGKVIELKNEFLRMRQISSGFLGYKDDEDGKTAQLEFKTNPKLELLLGLLASVVDEHKAVVFNEYTFSGSMICRELSKLGINHARIYGGTKDPGAQLRTFTEDPQCRVLVVNHQAGGLGLNLQCAKYVVYYESPVSPRVRIQSEARVHRQGSEHNKVYIYDLVAAPVDLALLAMHQKGKDLLAAILNGTTQL